MKKLVFLLAMVFAISMAMGQTNVDLDQSGSAAYWGSGLINSAGIQQVGTNVTGDFDQDAGTYNYLRSEQSGTDLSIDYSATAGTHNVTPMGVKGFLQSGSNGDIDITQVAQTGSNSAQTWQQGGSGNDIDVIQTAGESNVLVQRQYGHDHEVNLEQTAGTSNSATTYQGTWGVEETGNVLVGAELGSWGPLFVEDGPATQVSASSSNELFLDQDGSYNKVGLSQNGLNFNYAEIIQEGGDNSLLIYQNNVDGFNSVISNQVGGANSASVLQNTWSGSGTITVDQN